MISRPDDELLQDAARLVGLRADEAHRLWEHATTVYLLPLEQLIVRIRRGPNAFKMAERAVAVTQWLCDLGFPATAPSDVDQPLFIDCHTVTFWQYYPQHERDQPEPSRLAALLKELHQLPPPPIPLPTYQPLGNFIANVNASAFLVDDDRAWLQKEAEHLLEAYEDLTFPLGIGHIHGDAYPGNLLWNKDQVILGDWDETAVGPRELDLVNTYQGVRFGRTPQELRSFAATYDYDVTTWLGFPILRAMRDVHTLGSYIQLAAQGNERAAQQLRHRLDTLRRGDASALWTAKR